MSLSLDSLKQQGGFTGAPVKREIEWNIGEETYKADVYVRRLSYFSAVTDANALVSHGDLAAARIAHCIVDESGKPVFKVSDITGVEDDGKPVMDVGEDGELVERGQLNSSLGTALLVAISEVNEMGKKKAEN